MSTRQEKDEAFIRRLEFIRRIFDRIRISFKFYSGKLDLDYQKSLQEGKVPWRIVHYQHILEPEKILYPREYTSYVRPYTFRNHLSYYVKHCNVISLKELTEKINKSEPIEDKTVVLTFDGGYSDFFLDAHSQLVQYQLPATVFLATGFTGTMNLFWQDKVMGAMLVLKAHDYEFPQLPQLSEDFYKRIDKLDKTPEITLGKIALLIKELNKLPPHSRLELLISLGETSFDVGGLPEYQMFMTWEEVIGANSDLIDFGLHGHNYINVCEINRDELISELNQSIQEFAKHEIRPINVFSFPGGELNKMSRETLYELGIPYCLATGNFNRPNKSEKASQVLNRVKIYQDNSFCTERLACTLWENK